MKSGIHSHSEKFLQNTLRSHGLKQCLCWYISVLMKDNRQPPLKLLYTCSNRHLCSPTRT